MKISFEHGWFSHRARSSNFESSSIILINQFLPQLFFQILSDFVQIWVLVSVSSKNVYVRAVGLGACCVVAMIEVFIFQIQGCLTFHEKQVTHNPKAMLTTTPISS